jgi:prolyl 4-hydroxylase
MATSAEDITLTRLRVEADRGTPQALYQLATALVTRQELGEAFDLHHRAAQAGHANAQIETARMLMFGVGTDVDVPRAAEWLVRAEAAGSPVAGYFLALMAVGNASFPREGRTNERLLAAVNANYPPALRAAAIHFGRKPDERDQTLCLQLLERATNAGDAVAAQLLAERLARGEGCIAQPEAAEELWAQLAPLGIERLPEITVPLPGAPGPSNTLALEEALRPVPVQLLSAGPRIGQVGALLSADECRLLVATSRPHLQRSRTLDPQTGLPLAQEIRTSSDASFDPILEDLALRLVQLRMCTAARVALTQAEHLTVLRYEPGQQYRPHRDYRPPSSIEKDHPESGNRLRTICVYLNQVEEGGETEFPIAGALISPEPGRAVIFDNLFPDGRPDPDSLHAGLPVRRGEKWLATLWLRERRYRHY